MNTHARLSAMTLVGLTLVAALTLAAAAQQRPQALPVDKPLEPQQQQQREAGAATQPAGAQQEDLLSQGMDAKQIAPLEGADQQPLQTRDQSDFERIELQEQEGLEPLVPAKQPPRQRQQRQQFERIGLQAQGARGGGMRLGGGMDLGGGLTLDGGQRGAAVGTIVQGQLVSTREVPIEGTGETHLLVKVRTLDGRTAVIDLGPRQKLGQQAENLKTGRWIGASGEVGQINNRPVLFAKQLATVIEIQQTDLTEQQEPPQAQPARDARRAAQRESPTTQEAAATTRSTGG